MATYSHRVVHTETHEYTVPTPAAHAEIFKAWRAAEIDYKRLHGLPEDYELTDDALWFREGDGEIVIYFEVRKTAGA